MPRDEIDDRNVNDRLQSWIDAGILGEDGQSNGLSRWQEDVDAIKVGIQVDYARYESYLQRQNNDGYRKLTEGELKDFQALDARFKGLGSVEAAIQAEEANAESALARTIAAKDNYGWTQTELLYAVSDAIVNPDPSFTPQAGQANIKAQNVVLKTVGGSVGHEEDTKVIDFKDLKAEDYKTLARADISDVKWDKEAGTVTVTLKRPISVELTEGGTSAQGPSLSVDANKNVYIASDQKLIVDTVRAGNDVRLTANGIESLSANSRISGKTITLRAGTGQLGSAAQAVNIDSELWTALSAHGDIYVNEVNGDLNIMSVATDGSAHLTSGGNIAMYDDAEGAAQGKIVAQNLTLTTTQGGLIGTKDSALRTEGVQSLTVNGKGEANEVAGLYVHDSGSSETTLTNERLNSKSDIALETGGSLTVSGALASHGDLSLVAKDRLTVADKSALSAADGALQLQADDVRLGQNLAMDAQGFDLATNQAIELNGHSLTVGNGGLSLKTSQSLVLNNMTIAVREGASSSLVLEGRSVLVQGSTFKGVFDTVNGKALSDDLVFTQNSAFEAKGDVTLSALGGALDLAGQAISTTGDISINSHKDLDATGVNLSSKGVSISSVAGSVSASNAKLGATSGLNLHAQNNVDLSQTTLSVSGGALSVKAQTGDLIVKGAQGFKADSIEMVTGGDLTFDVGQTLEATRGSVALTVAGNLQAQGITMKVADGKDIEVAVSKSADLTNAKFEGKIQNLHLGAVDSLTLIGAMAGTKAGDFVSEGDLLIFTGGLLAVDNTALHVESKTGALNVSAGVMSVASGSVFQAQKSAQILVADRFEAGDNLTVIGSQVSVAGGTESFVIGNHSTFTATDGNIEVLASGNMTLGGEILVNASTQTDDVANVKIGAEGLLTVSGLSATVVATEGAVTVYGGRGMSIQDDLTVISARDTRIQTGLGDLTIGNGATVRAGTQSGLQDQQYGRIDVLVGGNFRIGENATMLSDALKIDATGDIRFGNDATLVGASKGGVQVLSELGSIYMGENLTVQSLADKTVFNAQKGDIVIERKAQLHSQSNAIEFVAGNDVRFDDDFTVYGTAFAIQAGNNVTVGNNANVKTEFGENNFPETSISAGNDITFGDRASFETTDLILSTHSGSVTFGDSAAIRTSYAGIVVNSAQNITFGRNAAFVTNETNVDADVSLRAQGGSLTLNDGATIDSQGNIYLTAESDLVIGNNAKVSGYRGDEKQVTLLQSETGNIVLGTNSNLEGYVVSLRVGDEDFTHGGSVLLQNGASVLTGDTFEILSKGNVEIEGLFKVETLLRDETHGAQEIRIQVHDGDIHLHDDADFYAHGNLLLNASGSVVIDDRATIVTDSDMTDAVGEHNIEIAAGKNVTFGKNTLMQTDANILISGDEGVSFAGGTQIGAMNLVGAGDNDNGHIAIQSSKGSVHFTGDADVYGDISFDITAHQDIVLTGQSQLDSAGSILLKAETGNIVMSDSIRLGGADALTDEMTQIVTLIAGGDIVQSNIGQGMGISAELLKAQAGGNVLLGAVGTGDDISGNALHSVEVDAGGDITVATDHMGFVNVTLNQSRDGFVTGDLKLVATQTELVIKNDVDVQGSVSVAAGGLSASDIKADGSVIVTTAGLESTLTEGVKTGLLSGSSVVVMTENGAIDIGRLVAKDGNADIYRKGTATEGDISIGHDSAIAGNLTVLNGNGNVSGQAWVTDSAYIFVKDKHQADISGIVAERGVAVQGGADRVVQYLPDIMLGGDGSMSSVVLLSDVLAATANIEAVKLRSLVLPKAFSTSVDQLDKLPAEEMVTDQWTEDVLKSTLFSAQVQSPDIGGANR